MRERGSSTGDWQGKWEGEEAGWEGVREGVRLAREGLPTRCDKPRGCLSSLPTIEIGDEREDFPIRHSLPLCCLRHIVFCLHSCLCSECTVETSHEN